MDAERNSRARAAATTTVREADGSAAADRSGTDGNAAGGNGAGGNAGDGGGADGGGAAGGPLRKAFAVLESMANASRPLTLSELSRLLNLPKSSLHRLMHILTDLGLVVRTESKYYVLGDYLYELTAAGGSAKAQSLSHTITPFLIELFQLTGKIVSVGMLSGTTVQHVGTLYGPEHKRLARALREPLPAYRSAAGRLLLATCRRGPAGPQNADGRAERMRHEFERIRRTGLSYTRGGCVPELVELAAPVHLGRADPVAAIVVCDTVNGIDPRSHGHTLLRTVGAIEESLTGPS
ncbi:IclR family transcriptional regulator [Streptomyces sp. Amel2xB2]|uniref:IclR family transcriptional regulator n=1 Tax=Streptomyces sp. Amel2xB2 TaxID=1305829 RepID=UPI0021ABFA24|nr:helix-turn-helix domain-containing protein [Streptomyces sp. Amel2xB2]